MWTDNKTFDQGRRDLAIADSPEYQPQLLPVRNELSGHAAKGTTLVGRNRLLGMAVVVDVDQMLFLCDESFAYSDYGEVILLDTEDTFVQIDLDGTPAMGLSERLREVGLRNLRRKLVWKCCDHRIMIVAIDEHTSAQFASFNSIFVDGTGHRNLQ